MQTQTALAAPAFSLARFVEDVSVVVGNGELRKVHSLPDGRTRVVFRLLEKDRRGDVSIAGPRTRAHFKETRDFVHAVVVCLKPGWSTPLFGVPTQALTDRIVTFEELWGRAGKDLRAELLGTTDIPETLEKISRAIGARVDQAFEPSSARLARRAAQMLEEEEVRVTEVADRLGVTSRHLRRVFTGAIGIGPKEYARAARLQRAVRMTSATNDWGSIAQRAGYYDQAHLIADFRELVGLTPTALAKRMHGDDALPIAEKRPFGRY
ncbi:MAG TPA: helix-turn-helix domain-containing protein [Polyangiaceae bacterium]